MKRLAVIIVALLYFMPILTAKDNPLRLKSGSLSPLKETGGLISCSLNFSKTKANRKPLEIYLKDDFDSNIETFHRYEPEMLQWFMERWDDDIEEGPQATSSENGKFKLNIIVKTLQMGAKTGWGGSSISGYAEFYRNNDSEPFAIVEILKINGTVMGEALYGYLGLKQVFSDLAEYLCDLIYHY